MANTDPFLQSLADTRKQPKRTDLNSYSNQYVIKCPKTQTL